MNRAVRKSTSYPTLSAPSPLPPLEVFEPRREGVTDADTAAVDADADPPRVWCCCCCCFCCCGLVASPPPPPPPPPLAPLAAAFSRAVTRAADCLDAPTKVVAAAVVAGAVAVGTLDEFDLETALEAAGDLAVAVVVVVADRDGPGLEDGVLWATLESLAGVGAFLAWVVELYTVM